jgi:acylphosphatase
MSQDVEFRRFLVSGRVQGVFFRVSTAERANSLGLSGRARNLANGQVEVVAFGSPAKLGLLASWLQQGPPSARVDAVISETINEVLAGELAPGRFQTS